MGEEGGGVTGVMAKRRERIIYCADFSVSKDAVGGQWGWGVRRGGGGGREGGGREVGWGGGRVCASSVRRLPWSS